MRPNSKEETKSTARIESLIKRFQQHLKGSIETSDGHCIDESVVIDSETHDIKDRKTFSKENCDLISH